MSANLTFIHGTFFEVLVCVSISMQMLAYGEFLNISDWVSVFMSFFFGTILLTYVLYLLYFTCVKSRLWVTKAKGSILAKQEETVKKIHDEILQNQTSLKPETEKEVEEILKLRRENSSKLIKEASKIREDQFEKFSPLVEDLRKDSLVSMSNNMFITVRRLLMLYLAMFLLRQ